MRVLAVVPARSGSRGLPNKNIRILKGRPLLDYAVRPALDCKKIDRVVVSTDSEEYAEIARGLGADVPFLRPPPLGEDVPTEDVLLHVLDEMRKMGRRYDIIVTLQCTTPFLKSEEIETLVSVINQYFDCSATVCEASEKPEWMFTRSEFGELSNIMNVDLKGDVGVRQSLPVRYRLNGAGYASKVEHLIRRKQIIMGKCFGLVMSKERSVDIDSELDFKIVEMLMS